MEGTHRHPHPWYYIGTIKLKEIHDLVEAHTKQVKRERKELIPFETMISLLYPIMEAHYGIARSDIQGHKRNPEFVYVRQFFCYFLRLYYGRKVSLKAIGMELNQADHTTVIHSMKKYQDRVDTDLDLPDGLPRRTTKEDLTIITQKIVNQCL